MPYPQRSLRILAKNLYSKTSSTEQLITEGTMNMNHICSSTIAIGSLQIPRVYLIVALVTTVIAVLVIVLPLAVLLTSSKSA